MTSGRLFVAGLSMLPISCGAPPPETLGPRNGELAPCPEAPACVRTGGDPAGGGPGPFLLAVQPDEAWPVVREAVESMARTRIWTFEADYLRAEATSLVFRFVDDLEVLLDRAGGQLVVRSASRVGRGDLGVNRRRVEDLRKRLTERGVLAGPGADVDPPLGGGRDVGSPGPPPGRSGGRR